MAQIPKDFTALLIKRGIVSADQLAEANKLAETGEKSVGDALITLGYASPEDVTRALADFHKIPVRRFA